MLHLADAVVVLAWLGLTLAAGVWFARRASRSTDSFFVSDRSLPWWVVGTSMVATTFAADTPLVVSGLAMQGIHANWFWWNFGLSGTLSVFLFARLWRRARVVTDQELVELRYGGRTGGLLRGAKALWFGGFVNVLVVAWVMGAMTKIVTVVAGLEEATVLGLPAEQAVVLVLFVLTVLYTGASGLYGVVATDVVQFVVALVAALGLAVLAWVEVGGEPGLVAGFAAHGFDWSELTRLVPLGDPDPAGATAQFMVLVGVVWWVMYNVDGGGYLAQRLFAAKDDRHALWAYLWFTVAHICLRPWPWIVVGLVGMALLGPVDDPETYYPRMMVDLLPPGLFGLMVASFLAAFMSTIDTQLNWGASLLVNDVHRRFLRPEADERSLVRDSRIAILLLATAGSLASFAIDEIQGAWKLAFSVTAGLGTVYIARWYWWRVTAWCELTALVVAGLCTLAFDRLAAHHPAHAEGGTVAWAALEAVPAGWLAFPFSAAATGLFVLGCWLPVAFLTAPDPDDPRAIAPLRRFYRRVRPGGRGWRRVAGDLPGFDEDGPGWSTLVGWLGSVAGVYGVLLGVGHLVLGRPLDALVALTVAAVGVALATRAVVEASRSVQPHEEVT